jgi:putative glycosyltransferase (TIGR04348 family)
MSVQVVIVTPALADANNGNWRTARRWARFLGDRCAVRVTRCWPDTDAARDRVMLALHARRSAASIAAWHAAHGSRGLGVVLTGTDLYRDIQVDAAARRSLDAAHLLVALQELGPLALPAEHRAKTRVIFQSAPSRRTLSKPGRRLHAVAVGHLRAEKTPETLFAAARLVAARRDISIDHVGAALDPALGERALATMRDCPGYRWLGGLPHASVRGRIQRAHVIVHCSALEGGAHVILEAVTSGTPVIASRIDGNVGMLGDDYAGYFPWGDAAALAALLRSCREGQPDDRNGLLSTLALQCRRRAVLFHPRRERDAVRELVDDLRATA